MGGGNANFEAKLMQKLKNSKHVFAGTRGRSNVKAILILPLMILIGCSSLQPNPPTESQLAVCKRGNREQLTSFWNMVQVSRLVDENGNEDPYEVRPGVLWVGAMLKRCFPEMFE